MFWATNRKCTDQQLYYSKGHAILCLRFVTDMSDGENNEEKENVEQDSYHDRPEDDSHSGNLHTCWMFLDDLGREGDEDHDTCTFDDKNDEEKEDEVTKNITSKSKGLRPHESALPAMGSQTGTNESSISDTSEAIATALVQAQIVKQENAEAALAAAVAATEAIMGSCRASRPSLSD